MNTFINVHKTITRAQSVFKNCINMKKDQISSQIELWNKISKEKLTALMKTPKGIKNKEKYQDKK